MRTFRLLAALALLGAPAAHAQPAARAQPAAVPGPATAASATAPVPAEAPPVAVDANFQLGIGDSVLVQLVGSKDADSHATVAGDGTVIVPLVGEVKALGLTADQLATAIQVGLKKGGYYSDPVVHVSVTGVASRYVAVLGDVAMPGLLPLDRAYHLSDIVARVGVHSGDGAGTIVLTHSTGQSRRYTLEEIATGGSGDGDPLIQAGDKLYVPSVGSEVIFVSGQVHAPGGFP